MSGTATQIDSFSSPFLLPHETFRSPSSSSSSSSHNNNNGGIAVEEIGSDNNNPTKNPWKKIDNNGSHHRNKNNNMNDLMDTSSWPALSQHPLALPHEVCSSALEKESGAKDTQTSSAHSISDISVTISKDNEREKFVSGSVVSSRAMDQVQKSVTEMESRTENSCGNSSLTGKVNGFSENKHDNEEPSKIIKTLPVSAGNGDKERQNSSDSSRTVPQFSTQRSFNTRLKQKPRSNQNQSNYSGFQNQKTSNRHQQPRSYNDRNSGLKHSNAQHVNPQNHIPGYINGFPLPHQPPSSPYAYIAPSTNSPPAATVPFLPIPYSIYPPAQYLMPMGYYGNSYVPGGQVHPQNSQINDFRGQDVKLQYDIRHQIEYYFSDENLVNDFFLRNQMDTFGWVSVDRIADFNKVKSMTKDVDLILRALQHSQVVEIQGNNIRKRNNWKTWILSNSLVNKIQNIQLDVKSGTKKMSVEPNEARRVSES
ncbi:hypothetical protein ACHQM5_016522 [Ranunculus cassubicifolius]